jgi:hypothetical protein
MAASLAYKAQGRKVVEPEMDVRQLITDIGPIVNAAEISEYAEDTWVVTFDDEVAVVIELDSDRNVLILNASLGAPVSGSELTAYKLLLQAALAWRETGGLRMGLDPDDDDVIQLCDLALAGMTPNDLAVRVMHFAGLARNGRLVMGSLVDPEESPRTFNFIRA